MNEQWIFKYLHADKKKAWSDKEIIQIILTKNIENAMIRAWKNRWRTEKKKQQKKKKHGAILGGGMNKKVLKVSKVKKNIESKWFTLKERVNYLRNFSKRREQPVIQIQR